MKRSLLATLLLVGVFACAKTTPKVMKPAPETEIVLLYNADDKGDYKECGCKSARLGGVVRRATVIRYARANHANVLAVHGGGWAMSGRLESQRVQSFFHLQVMDRLACTASNVTPTELAYGVEALRQAAAVSHLTLVASNLRSKSKDAYVFEPYTLVDVRGIRVGFLGVMEEGEPLAPQSREGDDLMTVDPEDAVRALLPEVRAKADLVVVFSHLTQRKTQQLVDDVAGIDIAISGKDGFVNDKATEVGNDSTGKCLIVEAGERGKYVGALTMVVNEHGKILRYENEVTALDKNIPDDSIVAVDVAALDERLRDIRKREAVEQVVGSNAAPGAAAPPERYLGAQACARCHVAEFESWKNSPHASTMHSLEAKGMEGSAQCLQCHVTGFNLPNGYPNARTERGSVSCEQCHGFGTQHGATAFVAKPTAQSCTTCHDAKNSPNFDNAPAWAAIAHGGATRPHATHGAE